jgi:hypothetical protein
VDWKPRTERLASFRAIFGGRLRVATDLDSMRPQRVHIDARTSVRPFAVEIHNPTSEDVLVGRTGSETRKQPESLVL